MLFFSNWSFLQSWRGIGSIASRVHTHLSEDQDLELDTGIYGQRADHMNVLNVSHPDPGSSPYLAKRNNHFLGQSKKKRHTIQMSRECFFTTDRNRLRFMISFSLFGSINT